ncbi:FAD:protein FMN transferase [Uliginosibacterium sp. 31-16]|uniref:FAD:protein FMN transferase n=1 Tax=Uliginosibacterium sp. 31-16 TaxID=3068315 RepID=UPI00273FBADE|nr:FAD:protein FMN transferase [Uliginosibacterium sp. 31-16]MDP5238524.1 FAD:protein FMN transferase [Uliginosibacterium sp. 31-16]
MPACSPLLSVGHILRHLLCICLISLLAGCGDGPLVRQESFVFGTRVEVVTQGAPEAQARDAIAAVLREFDRLHRTYHAWQPSELTRLNEALARGETASVQPEMLGLIRSAQTYSELGEHLFNPAIGRLIQLWGFHSDTFVARLPAPEALRQAVATQPHMSDLQIDGNQIRSRNPAVALDFGGIAKGWALDKAAAILREHGIHNALINIGGNVMALGSKGKQPWTVGIQHPRASGPLATLALYDGEAIGTSGDYQRFFDLNGQRYSHLLDPRTGEPARHTQAVTVLITPRPDAGMLSDVASKPVFLAADEWRSMARRFGVAHVLRVDGQGKIMLSTDMRARLRWAQGVEPGEVLE